MHFTRRQLAISSALVFSALTLTASGIVSADPAQQQQSSAPVADQAPAKAHATEDKTAEATEEARPEAETNRPNIQMAILLDTSSSMNGLINQARAQLWKIVNQFATVKQNGKAPNLTVAVYEYGNSGLNAKEGYIRQVVGLTSDLDKVSEVLFALTTRGGSEHCGQVIDVATRELDWSKTDSDLRAIFIAGNEPFTQGPVDYKKACQAAIDKGITISTIFCGDHQQGVNTKWQDGAQLADGSFMSIDQNSAVADIPAPQDRKLAELSTKLNETYVVFGGKKQRDAALANQTVQDANASGLAVSSAAARAQYKASGLYNNARWDLVDACKNKDFKMEDLKEEDLPENLKKMTVEERKKFVKEKSEQRLKIQTEIKELSAARDKYISIERRKLAEMGEESLDAALIKSLRTQAEKKNFKFEN